MQAEKRVTEPSILPERAGQQAEENETSVINVNLFCAKLIASFLNAECSVEEYIYIKRDKLDQNWAT